jgi:hypothetical protein
VTGIVKDAVTKRLSGDRPSPLKASLAAGVAGAAVAMLAYKVLRSQG